GMEQENVALGFRCDCHVCVRLRPNSEHIEGLFLNARGAQWLCQYKQGHQPEKAGGDATIAIDAAHLEGPAVFCGSNAAERARTVPVAAPSGAHLVGPRLWRSPAAAHSSKLPRNTLRRIEMSWPLRLGFVTAAVQYRKA